MNIEELITWLEMQVSSAEQGARNAPNPREENWEIGQLDAYQRTLRKIETTYSDEEEG